MLKRGYNGTAVKSSNGAVNSVSERPTDFPLHPSSPQRLPTALLSMDKKIINRSLHYPISSRGTFLPLPAGGKINKQTGKSCPVLIWSKPVMLPHICSSLGLEFWRQTQASAPKELLLHTGPKCQTTATHHKPGYFPSGPLGKGDSVPGQSQGFEPVTVSLGVWPAQGQRCQGNCNFQNHLHPLETSSLELRGFLSQAVLHRQHACNRVP